MPHIKDDYYFSHDMNARNDKKVKAMIRKYGMAGYGRWWVLVETLRSECNYKLQIDPLTLSSLAEDMRTEPQEVEQFIADCVNEFTLLEQDGDEVWSESLLRRMSKMDDSRARRSEAGKKGMASRWSKEEPKKEPKPKTTPKATPKPENTEVVQLEKLYIKLFEQKYNSKPEISYARDRKILNDIIGGRGFPDAIALLTDYFSLDDEYINKAGHTIPVFKSAINQLLARQKKKKPGKVLDSNWVEEQRKKRMEAEA